MDKDLTLALKDADKSRSEKRKEMVKTPYYQKLFKFLESRFDNGESYTVKNYFETYKMIIQDSEGKDKTIYGFIADNDKTYLGWNDLAFPKKLYKREIRKVNGEEFTEYTQLDDKVYQGDLSVLYHKFKNAYKDALTAFDLLYIALAKHNESRFVSESFIYPTETFQCFKSEYTTANFYLFNLQIGGTSEEKLNEIFDDVCSIYEKSRSEETPAEETPAEN